MMRNPHQSVWIPCTSVFWGLVFLFSSRSVFYLGVGYRRFVFPHWLWAATRVAYHPLQEGIRFSKKQIRKKDQSGCARGIGFRCFSSTVWAWKLASPSLGGETINSVRGILYLNWYMNYSIDFDQKRKSVKCLYDRLFKVIITKNQFFWWIT